ncbi:hypothetical protein F2Q69_00025192 [Brassica cretica]|uniref:NTF2 domain-containing protein n=1 Tax=Brassica cretica TaxID=69181 RepID=A0A8S9QIN2_BRACR|nr:hypothetical protein F2Q69_00025192 [Brassica cretica]
MAHQEASTSPGAEVVGRAFVEQYYHILHQSPGLVHRFYQDSSLLTRPDVTGSVTTVTTMQAINEKIMSLKYEDYTAEIETADAQESYERGVIVLVTGCLTGSDNVRKRFSQTFFLSPQDKGYFVLNDVFRYLEEKDVTAHNGTTRDVQAPVEPEHVVVSHEAEVEPEPVASIEEEDLDNVAEVYDPSDKDEGVVVDAEPIQPPPQLSHSEVPSVPRGDPPKHSYASIMAHQEASTSPGAEVVGRAFVEQYYHILHQSPGLVHRFYQDSSLLTRPDVTGSVTTVTTMQAINEKIMSLKYEDYTAEIETADAQDSYERGVIVLVTGCLTGSDNVRKRFSQTFFLAPQDKGYFVLNDVFRFLEEKDVTAHNGTTRDVQAPVEPELVVVSHEAEVEPEPVASIEEEDLDNVAEVYDPSDKDEGVVVDAEPIQPPPQLSHSEVPSVPRGDPPKHSYASIAGA